MLKVDMFVIPNRISKNEVQIWLCNEYCDNMQDHSFSIVYNGERYVGRIKETTIPYSTDMIEDSEIELTFTFTGIKDANSPDDGKHFEFPVKVLATCNQLDYRYRRFGRFEEAAAYATAC